MKVSLVECRKSFLKYLDKASRSPVEVCRNGKSVGVIISLKEYETMKANIEAAHKMYFRTGFGW